MRIACGDLRGGCDGIEQCAVSDFTDGSQNGLVGNSKFVCEGGRRGFDLLFPTLRGRGTEIQPNGPFVEIEAEGRRLDPDVMQRVERSVQMDVAAKDDFVRFEERFYFGGGSVESTVADCFASHR